MNEVENVLDFIGDVIDMWVLLIQIIVSALLIASIVLVFIFKSKKSLIMLMVAALLSGILVGIYESSVFLGLLVAIIPAAVSFVALSFKLIKEKV
jgi:hypothetical protein